MLPSRPTVALTRAYRFTAAHYYYDAALSPEENDRRFGDCARRPGHGHDYRLEVTLRAAIAPAAGMVFDLRELDGLVKATILDKLDDRHLNHDVAWFADHLPTTENLALYAWNALVGGLPAGILAAVRMYESADLFAEYQGEGT